MVETIKNYIKHHDLPDNLEVKDDFKEIYNVMEYSKQNMFITGKAGSGKTTLLEYFRINSKKNFVILASTGISAIKAKGKTIHSFFLFPPRILINEKIKRLPSKIIGKVETILIDECSMIRSDVLDGIDQSLKLSIFLAGAVAESEENKELMHIKGWKLSILGKAIEEVMLENNYHKWDLNWFLLRHPKNLDNSGTLLYLKRISYSQGGRLTTIGIDIGDDYHKKINISIFLDTLEEGDGYYADFEAGPVTVDRYKKLHNL